MSMTFRRAVAATTLVAASFALAAPHVAAQLPSGTAFTYEWYSGGVPVAGPLNFATPNFTLQVFLRQTAGSNANLLATENGLFGGGVRATYGTPGVVNVPTVSDIAFNPAFNDLASSNPTRQTNANFAQFRAVTDGLAGAPASNGIIHIGTFNFQAVSGGTTTLTAGTVPILADTVTFSNLLELDPVITTHAITITVVPEPATVLGVTALVGFVGVRIRRRWGKEATA